ncbi:MAG: hypothetical protein R3A47_12325 [Polyangiales bacterium]
MILRGAAIRPVPTYAVVGDDAIERVEEKIGDNEESLQQLLDDEFRRFDRNQPEMAQWVADTLAETSDELAQSVGYFLSVTIYMAFAEAFPTRLDSADAQSIEVAMAMLQTDEELRRQSDAQFIASDDVVAMGQPDVIAFVQHHMEEALAQANGTMDPEALELVYRAVLVQVMVLSQCVHEPAGDSGLLKPYLA